MGFHHELKQLACCLLVSCAAVTTGCQGLRGARAETGAPPAQTVIPQLSTPPESNSVVAQASGAQLSSVPAESTSGQLAQAGWVPPAVPPVDTPAVTSDWTSVRNLPAPPLAAAHPESVPLDPPPPQKVIQQVVSCPPVDMEWRRQMEEQTSTLTHRLLQVETELVNTRGQLLAVSKSLHASEARIDELNRQVAHWKREVERIESDMKAQQLADLKSLDELTASMHQVILKQAPQAASPGVSQ